MSRCPLDCQNLALRTDTRVMLYLCLAAGVNLAIDLEGQPQIPESGEEDCYSPPRKIIETESQT